MHFLDIPPDINATLHRTYLFASLDSEQLQQMKQHMKLIALQEGERLFEHGQPAERFYLLREGQIKLGRVFLDGTEKVIEIIQPGQTFAEAVMFMDRKRYPVGAAAIGDAQVYSFNNKVFLQVLRESMDTCMRLMGDMSMYLRRFLNELDHLTLQNATYRLVSYLLSQLLAAGVAGQPSIELQAAKSIIASRLSIQPETFSRILNNLCRSGIISVHGRSIDVHDPARLRELTGA